MQLDSMSKDAVEARVLEGPILRTFIAYAIPSLIGLVAISTASIVDGLFVSRFVGSDALAAVSLLLPYFTTLFGVSLMFAVGGSVRAGRYLGAGDLSAANAMFGKSLVAVVVVSACAAALGNANDELMYRLLGAPPQLFPLMREYFRPISAAMVVQLAGLLLYYFVRLDGRPVLATAAVVGGAAANVALDALFVGHWRLGVGGSAWATLLAQLLQLCVVGSHFASRRARLRLELPRRGFSELFRSAFNGASELVNEVSVGAVALIVNWLMVSRVGVHGVSAFTIVNYASFASLMVYYGLSDSLHLLVSQNLGAGKVARTRALLRSALCCAVGFGALACGSLLLFGDRVFALFADGSSPQVLEQALGFLALLWPVLLMSGANVISTVYLAAMHRPAPAALLALSRSLVLPAGFLLGLALLAPDTPFLLAFPLAEAATLALAVTLTRPLASRAAAPLAREGRVVVS
jgi:Na+-driven multidrug efflux pump